MDRLPGKTGTGSNFLLSGNSCLSPLCPALRILGRPSAPVWQDESYDHLVRDRQEFERIRLYIAGRKACPT
jgi:hypothetical protein